MSQEPTSKRVYGVESFAYLFVAVVVLFTVVGFALVLPDAIGNSENAPFDIFWLAVLGWFWFNILRSPYRVTLQEDRLDIRCLARRLSIPVSAVTEVRRLEFRSGVLLNSTQGRVWFRAYPNDMFDLLTRLRQINPDIRIRGV